MASRATTASKTRIADAIPDRFGREEPYDFEGFERFFRSDYAPRSCRCIHLGCADGRVSVDVTLRTVDGVLAKPREIIALLGLDPAATHVLKRTTYLAKES